MLKQKILLRKYRNIFSVLVRFFLLYFLKKLYIMHTPGKVKFWQSRGQRFDPAILHQGKPWNHNGFEVFSYIWQTLSAPLQDMVSTCVPTNITRMVSRFFLIYGKLHKVAFVLNLCWTRGKISPPKTLKPQRFMFIGTQCNLWGKPDGTGHGK